MTLGTIDNADAMITYLQPLAAMKLLRLWQALFGTELHVKLSGFLSVCSYIAAAICKRELCLSFGCPDSRKYGGIDPDKMVIVIPAELYKELNKRSLQYTHL